jgi:hypothetical protein
MLVLLLLLLLWPISDLNRHKEDKERLGRILARVKWRLNYDL